MSIVLLSNDLDVVLMSEIYQNPYPQIMYHKEVLPESGPTAVLSMQVANHIINKIIEVGTHILKEHRFNKLVIPRTKDTCFSLIHSVLASEFILQESPPDHINDDAEPDLDTMDNWGRYHISFQKKSELDQKGKFDWELAQKTGVMPIDSRKQYTKAREKAKKHLKEFEKQEVPQPVDLREEEISDKFEERLREENEKKLMKQEKENDRQRQERAMEASAKLKNMSKDRSKRFHTFDFDGRVIFLRPINQDSLPPPSFQIE